MLDWLFGRKKEPVALEEVQRRWQNYYDGGYPIVDAEFTEVTHPPFTFKTKPELPPQRVRVYTAQLTNGVTMHITAKQVSFLKRRFYDGELVQGDGSRIHFSPEFPAEDIVDRALLYEVVRLCPQIIAADMEFMKTPVLEYTDSQGRIWVPYIPTVTAGGPGRR